MFDALHDFGGSAETRVTNDSAAETAPSWSPDGKLLAFVRNYKELCVYDLASKPGTCVRFDRHESR